MAVQQQVIITELSQDLVKNTSQVRILWTSTQTEGSYNLIGCDSKYSIYVNNVKVDSGELVAKLPKRTTQTIVDKTIEVEHDSLGAAVVSVETYMETNISAGIVRLNEALQLSTIARASTISSSDAYIESSATIVVNARNEAYYHSIYFTFHNLSGYINASGEIVDTEVQMQNSVINFLIPTEFYNQMTDSAFDRCSLVCTTYLDGVSIGSTNTTFIVRADPARCVPSVSVQAKDINPATIALTGNSSVVVKSQSNVQLDIQSSAANGAYIKEIRYESVKVPGVNNTTIILEGTYSSSFTVTVTDSRGFTNSATAVMHVIQYIKLTCDVTAEREEATSDVVVVHISGAVYDGEIGDVLNTLYITVGTSEQNAQTYSVEYDGFSYMCDLSIEGLDYTTSHTITVVAADKLCTVERSVNIKPGIPVFDWGQSDFDFHVPVNMPQLRVNGETIYDHVIDHRVESDGVDGFKAYRKWASGIAEVWILQSVTFTGMDTSWGNLFVSNTATPRIIYPIRFATTPVETAILDPVSGGALTLPYQENSYTSSGTYKYLTVFSGGIDQDTQVNLKIYATGYWKDIHDM